jgi:hypothetical protein
MLVNLIIHSHSANLLFDPLSPCMGWDKSVPVPDMTANAISACPPMIFIPEYHHWRSAHGQLAISPDSAPSTPSMPFQQAGLRELSRTLPMSRVFFFKKKYISIYIGNY